MSGTSHRTRARAGLLLLGFVVALLVGVLGHPFDEALHVCDGGATHLESAPAHQHDAQACASCHLFQTLEQSDGSSTASTSISAPALAFFSPRPSSAHAERRALFAFDSRGPPA